MSALEFLSPSAGPVSEEVVARSPMERAARAAGARFERRDGWNVAVGFDEAGTELERTTRSVAFADRSQMTKLELSAPGHGLRPGSAELRDGAWWCPVTPGRLLVLGGPEATDAIQAALGPLGGRVVDLTSALCALSLIGPGARELLARFCAIDVRPQVAPVGSFRPGSVARTPGYLLVEDAERLLIMVGWALGQYLWEVVADAAAHLGGGPVGAEVLARA